MVIWIIGLSGAGKTTIGREVYRLWKEKAPNTVLVDGDEVREVFKLNERPDPYSTKSRHEIAIQYHNLCTWLDQQGINVVCCTISNFNDVLQNNKHTFSRYFEVYVSVPLEVVVRRDTKNLYKPAMNGEGINVVGVDIPFQPPPRPDLIIDNSQDGKSPAGLAREILLQAQLLLE